MICLVKNTKLTLERKLNILGNIYIFEVNSISFKNSITNNKIIAKIKMSDLLLSNF